MSENYRGPAIYHLLVKAQLNRSRLIILLPKELVLIIVEYIKLWTVTFLSEDIKAWNVSDPEILKQSPLMEFLMEQNNGTNIKINIGHKECLNFIINVYTMLSKTNFYINFKQFNSLTDNYNTCLKKWPFLDRMFIWFNNLSHKDKILVRNYLWYLKDTKLVCIIDILLYDTSLDI